MRITLTRLLATTDKACSKSNVKYFRKTKNGYKAVASIKKKLSNDIKNGEPGEKVQSDLLTEVSRVPENNTKYRENEMKIQMLSKPLYEQIFKNCPVKAADPVLVAKYSQAILDFQFNHKYLYHYILVFYAAGITTRLKIMGLIPVKQQYYPMWT